VGTKFQLLLDFFIFRRLELQNLADHCSGAMDCGQPLQRVYRPTGADHFKALQTELLQASDLAAPK